MTVEEVRNYLHTLMWWLDDHRERHAAWIYEDAYLKLHQISATQCREYVKLLFPSDHRLRVIAVLNSRVHARAMYLLRLLLRSVES